MTRYSKIVVGTDGSETAMLAVDRAGRLAADSGAELWVVSAYDLDSDTAARAAGNALSLEDSFLVEGSAPAESALARAANRARDAGAQRVETRAVQGAAVSVLCRAVQDVRAELLVVGNVGMNTLSGRILGSVPQALARHAGVDVLVVHTSSF